MVQPIVTQLETAADLESVLDVLVNFTETLQVSYYLFYFIEDIGLEHCRHSGQFSSPHLFFEKIKTRLHEPTYIECLSDAPEWRPLWVEQLDNSAGTLPESVILSPIDIHLGRAQGLILVGREQPQAFSQETGRQIEEVVARLGRVLTSLFTLEDAQAAQNEAQILIAASRVLSSTLDLEVVYKTMGQVFLSTGADKCTLGIYLDPDHNDMATQAQIVDIRGPAAGEESLQNLGRIFHLEQNLTASEFDRPGLKNQPASKIAAETPYPLLASGITTRRIIAIADVLEDPRLNDNERAVFTHLGIRAHANIPLFSHDIPLGFVLVEYQTPYTFSDRELALLRTLANQTTIAIEHSRRIADTQQRARQIQTGAEISKIATSILQHRTLIKKAVNLIRDGFDFYYVGLFLVDDAGHWAVLQAGSGKAGELQVAEGHKLAPDDSSMIGQAITHKLARINLDVDQEAIRFDNPHLPLTRSEMALPLISRDLVIGAISIQSDKPRAFSQDDIVSLQIMADQIANALQNARLFQRVNQTAEELSVLLTINRDISAHMDLEPLLGLIISKATDVAQGDQATIFLLEDNYLVPKAVVGDYAEETLALRIPLGDGATGEAALTRQSVIKHVETPDAIKQIPGTPPIQETMAAVPIQTDTRLIGVLLIRRLGVDNKLADHDLRLLEAIALQAAIAVENASLLNQTQQARQNTEKLYRMSRLIAQADSVDTVATIAVQHVATPTLDRIVIALQDDPDSAENTWVQVIAIWDRDGEEPKFLGNRFSADELPILNTQAISDELIIKNFADHPRIDEQTNRVFASLGVKSAAILPIRIGQRILGWLLAETTHRHHHFLPSDITPLRTVVDLLAVTIDRIQKSESLLQATQQYSTMVESIPGVVYRAQLEPGHRFQYISDDIADMTGYMAQEFQGQSSTRYAEIVHPDDLNRVQTYIQNQLNLQQPYQLQYRILTKSGEIKYISEQGRGTFNRSGKLLYVDGVLNDVTARETLQRAFQRRAAQFEAIVEVGQNVSALLDVEMLQDKTVEDISLTFGFYYAGLFLLDEAGDWAILKAGSGEAGKRMVAEGHRLRRDETSMVGYATLHGQARIALDAGQEPNRFEHPYLPLTQSEIALPLITRGQVIGALDVQSQEQHAFSDDDIITLQLMANQLANAIENARLFETSQQSLHEANLLYQTTQALMRARSEKELFALFVEKAADLGADSVSVSTFGGSSVERHIEVRAIWSRYETSTQPGDLYLMQDFPLTPLVIQPELLVIHNTEADDQLTEAMRHMLTGFDVRSLVIIPILQPGPVGTVHITYKKETRTFSDSQIRLFESLVQQLSLIWQNLQLFTSIQKQFRREQIIRQVTGKIHASSGIDTILQTTVTELNKVFDVSGGVARLKVDRLTQGINETEDEEPT